jgi:hypothetical protein
VSDNIRHRTEAIEILSLDSEAVGPLSSQVSDEILMKGRHLLSIEDLYKVTIQAIIHE